MQRPESPIEKAAELLRRKMTNLGSLSDVLVRDVKALARDRVEISANRAIVKENERCPQIYMVESGWVFRSRGLASGRRQIVNYALPGDILCADSLLFKASSFDLTARTPVSLIRIEAPLGSELFDRHPGLAAAIAWTMGQEDSILAERGEVAVKCEFCNNDYHFDAVDSAQLFTSGVAPQAPTSRH